VKPRDEAERVYGLSAALAAFAERPDAVMSIAHTESARKPLAEMLRQAAKRHIAYREVDDESLGRMAQSVHHEGVCLLLRPRPAPGPKQILERVGARGLVVALDGVQNPHNVGAILRTAAYFGARAMVMTKGDGSTPLTAAARRVAEGGAELVPVAQVASMPNALRKLAEGGMTILGTDARAKVTTHDLRWPERVVLVLGNERDGMTTETRQVCSGLVRIPGTEAVDSLNVSVAAGVLLAGYSAAHGFGRAS
jgi:RNA methyltransferase, TrmH family